MLARRTARLTIRVIARHCAAAGFGLTLAACSTPDPRTVSSPAASDGARVATSAASPALTAEHGDHSAHATASAASPQPAEHATPAPSSQARAATSPVATTRVGGSGEGNSGPFELEQGLVAFRFDHPTDTPFGAFLLNAAGEHLALLANGTVVTGTQIYGIQRPGAHSLHVLAADAWSVDVAPLAATGSATDLPARFSGHGSEVTPPLVLRPGQIRVRWTHTGILPATLVGWSVDGQQRLDAFSNMQAPDGAVPLDVAHGGTYLFNVLADGAWTLVVEPR